MEFLVCEYERNVGDPGEWTAFEERPDESPGELLGEPPGSGWADHLRASSLEHLRRPGGFHAWEMAFGERPPS